VSIQQYKAEAKNIIIKQEYLGFPTKKTNIDKSFGKKED
jgi:hypothetical protein